MTWWNLKSAADCDPAFPQQSFVLFGLDFSPAAYGPLTSLMQKAGDKKFAGPEWDHYKRSVLTPADWDLLLTLSFAC